MDVDPFAESVLADPVMVHASIREAAPAVWVPKYQAWFVGRDAEVREALNDWRRFSSAFGVGLRDIQRDGSWQKPSVILEVDPPDHTVTRRVLNRILSQKAMRTMRADFERFASALVDELVQRGEFDAVQDLAWRFPATVLPDAVGITSEGREHLSLYSAMYFNNRIPGNRLADESTVAAGDAGSLDWVAMACSREHLTPGGFGAQIFAAVDAGEIDEGTASTLVRTFLGGGVDTTVLGLGSMLMLLATNPPQWDKLCGQPDLARAAFDETLRLAPPAPMIGRTTTGPTELGGVSLGPREKLFLLVGAANRDPRRWDDPDEFEITRNTAGQLAFGLGPHFCVGHAVARLEAEVVLAALIERVERIEICGEPVPELNNWLYGPRHLPVTVTPRT
ncbi:MAG TPA: cytochrome P450 [Ilumatobacter sp.]|nr:cytochrome P450 [Ilumatobacter sp.]